MVHDYTTSPSLQESWEPIEPMENNNISLQVSQITFLQVPGLGDWNHHWNGRLTKRGCWCKNNPRTNVFRPAMSWVNYITNMFLFGFFGPFFVRMNSICKFWGEKICSLSVVSSRYDRYVSIGAPTFVAEVTALAERCSGGTRVVRTTSTAGAEWKPLNFQIVPNVSKCMVLYKPNGSCS